MEADPDKSNKLDLLINGSLRLELINESHAKDLFNLTDSNREYLREWLPWVDSTKNVNNTLDFIKDSTNQFHLNNGFQLIIKYNNELAGILGSINTNNFNNHTEIGYWLGRSYSGKGLMTSACRALTGYCFDKLNLNRVVIKCASENFRSRRIPERLGFKTEGILRQEGFLNGKYVDHVLYAMLKEEWIAK